MDYYFDKVLAKWRNNSFTKDITITDLSVNSISMSEVFGVKGFLTQADILYLWNIGYNMKPNSKYLEIGSWMGLSSIMVAFGLLSNTNFFSKIYCVDPWYVMPEQENFSSLLDNTNLYQTFLDNISKTKVSRFIKPLRGKSLEVEKNLDPLEKFDVIFIDGEHTFEACYDDIITWLPRLNENALMIGHDAAPESGVEQALKKLAQETDFKYNIIEPPYASYIWQKL